MMKEDNGNIQNTGATAKRGISFVSLMIEDFRHRKWMLVLSSVVQLLLGPMVTLFILSRYHSGYNISTLDVLTGQVLDSVDSLYRGYLGGLSIVVALCGALIVGIGGFRHLFNRSMTDMMNSVPVKRGKQFAVIYLNGFLMWFVPFMVSGVVTLIIVAAKLGSYGVMPLAFACTLQMFAGALVTFLCVYHLAVLAATISGTIFNSLVNLLCLGLDVSVAYLCMILMSQTFFDNFWRPSLDTLEVGWMSPLFSSAAYGFVIADRMDRASLYFDSLSTVICLILTMVVGIINIIVAYRIYVTRKSEAAESGTIGKIYKFVLKVFNSVLAGLFVAILVKTVIGEDGYTFWCMFITALFVVLMFGILEIIQKKSFRSFFDHIGQMIGSVIIAEIILSVFMFDMINFDNHIVPGNNIAEAYIRMDSHYYYYGDTGCGYTAVEGKPGYITWTENRFNSDHYSDVAISGELAERIMRAEKIYDERWNSEEGFTYEIVDPVTGMRNRVSDNDSDYITGDYVYFVADRKTGPDFYRSYRIADPELALEISKLDEFRDINYPLNCGLLGYPLSVQMVDDYGNPLYSFSEDEMKQVMDAYFNEFRTNYDEKGKDVFDENVYEYQLICRYEMVYNDSSTGTHFFYIYLRESDTTTAELIEKLTGVTMEEMPDHGYQYYKDYEDVYYGEAY